MPEVSLMIPTFNRGSTLQYTLESAFNQTFRDLEILIYDDGSTDSTKDILRGLRRTDARLVIARGMPQKGEAAARNILLSLAKGKYGIWQDSDDYSNIHRVEMMLRVFKRMKPALLWSCVMAHRNPVGDAWTKYPFYSRKISRMVATTMFRIDQAVKYDERIWLGSDGVWAHQMMAQGPSYILPFMLYHVTYTGKDRMSEIWRKPENDKRYKQGLVLKDKLIEAASKKIQRTGRNVKPDCVAEGICHEVMAEVYGLDFVKYWKGL